MESPDVNPQFLGPWNLDPLSNNTVYPFGWINIRDEARCRIPFGKTGDTMPKARQRFRKVRKANGVVEFHINGYVWNELAESAKSAFRQYAHEENVKLVIDKQPRGTNIDNSHETISDTNRGIKQHRVRQKCRDIESLGRKFHRLGENP